MHRVIKSKVFTLALVQAYTMHIDSQAADVKPPDYTYHMLK